MYSRLTILALTVAVASCGGGGSSGGGAPASSVTPTPTPAPTATPSPTPAPASAAPFGLTQSAAMGALGLVQTIGAGQVPRWLSPGELQVSWQASGNTFAMTIPPYGSGTLIDDPGEAAPSARFLVVQGNRQAKVNMFVPDQVFGASNFVLNGSWARLDGDSFPDGTSGSFLYFTADSVRTPPATGAASYRFGTDPAIKARLSFDFAAGTVTGEVPLTWTDAWGPYPEVRYAVRDGKYDRATGAFTGAFDIPGSGFSGEFRGQIVGSGGQAMAIVIRGATYNPYDQKWVAENTLTSHLRE